MHNSYITSKYVSHVLCLREQVKLLIAFSLSHLLLLLLNVLCNFDNILEKRKARLMNDFLEYRECFFSIRKMLSLNQNQGLLYRSPIHILVQR